VGRIDEADVPAVVDAIRGVASRAAPFDVAVRGLGAFPSAAWPRVIWAGLQGAGLLVSLAGEVDAALAALGVPTEARPFAAHVTLGRVREPRRNSALADALRSAAELGRLPVTRLALMRSDLDRRGARYTELATVLLAPAASPVE
jgi:RNA 2',3'-cyclic 3'-phosphodiesterase